eukprot:7344274-Prymnesium_polylepis.1
MGEAAAADYAQAAAGPSGRAATAQPAARDADGGSASPTATPDGVLASSEGGPGSAGAGVAAAAAGSGGGHASSAGDT